MYSSAAHACCGLWLQIVILAALKKRVLLKFNAVLCATARGFWRANGAKGLLQTGGRSIAADLPSRPGALPRVPTAQRAMPKAAWQASLEIAKMRSEGATQAEIDRMLDAFEEVYAPDEDAEGKLVVAVLRQAARLPS